MSNNSLLTQVTKLTDKNWNTWKDEVMMVLVREEAWDIVSGVMTEPQGVDQEKSMGITSAKWKRLDQLSSATIYFTIDESFRYLIKGKTSGSEAWQILKTEFEKNVRSRRYEIRRRFNNPIHDPSIPVVNYINGITSARDELTAIGIKVEETETCDMILMHLDSSFQTIADVLTSQPTEPSLSQIQASLVEYESSRKAKESNSAHVEAVLAARSKNGSKSKGRGSHSRHSKHSKHSSDVDEHGCSWGEPQTDDACWRCGKPGHIASKCVADMPKHIKDRILRGERANTAASSDSDSSSDESPPSRRKSHAKTARAHVSSSRSYSLGQLESAESNSGSDSTTEETRAFMAMPIKDVEAMWQQQQQAKPSAKVVAAAA